VPEIFTAPSNPQVWRLSAFLFVLFLITLVMPASADRHGRRREK
jgi:hypothetical protein